MARIGGRTGTVLLAAPKIQAVVTDTLWESNEFWFGCQGTNDFRLIVDPLNRGNVTIIPFSRSAAIDLAERIQSVLAMEGKAPAK